MPLERFFILLSPVSDSNSETDLYRSASSTGVTFVHDDTART